MMSFSQYKSEETAEEKSGVWLKLFLLVNVALCMYGLSHLLSPKPQAQPLAVGRPAGARRETMTRSLLTAQDLTERYRRVGEYQERYEGQVTAPAKCDCKCPQEKGEAKLESVNHQKGKPDESGVKSGLPVKIGDDYDKTKEYQVPNIVHYIWYNTEPKPFEFHQMLAVMSASKYINPDTIYFHTDNEPVGRYWERTKQVAKLRIVKRDPPVHIFGEDVKKPHYYTSHSNVDRLKVLMEYGGIYLDFDVFATRSFDDLRKHACTIGFESDEKSCGSVIVASKDAFFLILWMNSYFDDYRIDEWAYNTGKVPFNLANRYPHLVHVDKTKINRPNFMELDVLYGNRTWNWRENYAVHTWYRLWKSWSGMYKGVEPGPDNIKTLNNTFGQIARSILYDSSDIILR